MGDLPAGHKLTCRQVTLTWGNPVPCGTSKKDRNAFDECMEYIREGDTLVVTRIDRLTRSILDLQTLLHDLKDKDINLKALDQPVDTSSASGKFFLDMLGVFAEFETNLRGQSGYVCKWVTSLLKQA